MLVNPHSENQDDAHEHEPQPQKYETMQCFAVSEPKSIKEEGDGTQTLKVTRSSGGGGVAGHLAPSKFAATTSVSLNGLNILGVERHKLIMRLDFIIVHTQLTCAVSPLGDCVRANSSHVTSVWE